MSQARTKIILIRFAQTIEIDNFRLAVDSYHKYEGFILDDYLSTVRSTEEAVEQSGCMFLAMRAVARNPVGFYCANPKSAIYLKQDSKFGLDQDKDNLDLDQLRVNKIEFQN